MDPEHRTKQSPGAMALTSWVDTAKLIHSGHQPGPVENLERKEKVVSILGLVKHLLLVQGEVLLEWRDPTPVTPSGVTSWRMWSKVLTTTCCLQ